MPAPTGYVDDYAGVFSDSAKSDMDALCTEVHDKTKAQIFVVTIHSLDGASIEQFSNDLFHTWLFVFVDSHQAYIQVGYGLEGILNDAKVGDMGRAMLPDLRAANYDAAATLGLHSVAQAIADDSKVELAGLQAPGTSSADENQQAPPPADDAPVSSESHTGKFILALLPFGFGLAFFGFVAWAIIRARHGTGTSGGGGWSSGGDSSSSDSDSSSGDSFSGGDGGDSGGGGASGSW